MYFKVAFINFFRRTLRFGAILSDHFDHILIGEKTWLLWRNDQKWSFMITQRSSLEILVLSPRSKFGGPKRTSRTGQEDGWEKKQKKSFLRGEFCRTKTPIFRLFWKFAKLAILIGEFLRQNGAYTKNGVYHDEGNEKCKKTVISDFLFSNFRHRDFLI